MERPFPFKTQVFAHGILNQLRNVKLTCAAAIGFGGIREAFADPGANGYGDIATLGQSRAQPQILEAEIESERRVIMAGEN